MTHAALHRFLSNQMFTCKLQTENHVGYVTKLDSVDAPPKLYASTLQK